MIDTTNHIPAGLTAVTPYLLVSDVEAAIDCYRQLFGAEEVMRYEDGGRAVHAKLRIGNAVVELGRHGERAVEDTADLPAVGVHLYVPDVDAVLEKAAAAGSRILFPVMDQPYGDREATIADPFGVVWFVATHLHD